MSAQVLDAEFLIELGAQCQRAFSEDGNGDAAGAVHQQVEAVVAAAEAQGLDAVADAAFELSVYLCSLVESLSPAGEAARQRIERMCDELVAAVDAHAVSAGPERSRAPLAPLVVQLVVEPQSQLDLAAELGSRHLRVDRAATLEELSRVLCKQAVEVLVIDAYWLDRCSEVMRLTERGGGSQLHDPAYLAIVSADDRPRRLFALRAGIDRVLEAGLAVDMAAAIADFVQERRRAAFRVLVVEDDRAQAMYVRSVLAHRGIEAVVASNAEEALSLTAKYRPDLFLLDLHLPDRNGIELAQLLRERPGLDLVPIVFLSGEPSMEEHFRAMRLGGDAWVSKPVKPRHLLAVVEARAERARRLRGRNAPASANEARPGMLSRARLVEMLGESNDMPALSPRLLLAVAPCDMPGVEQGVNFVAQGRLSEDIARFLASHACGRLGVCQPAPFLSLVVVEIESAGALLLLEQLQAELSGFGWLSREFPIYLPFALGAVWLEDQRGQADELIARAQQQLALARSGPGRVQLQRADADDAPPFWRRLRELFARDVLGDQLQFGFRPLLPIRGRLNGQFIASYQLRLGEECVSAEECLRFSHRHGMAMRLDQTVFSQCMRLLRERADAGASDSVLGIAVGADSLEDERFAAWVRAELGRYRLASAQLSIWVDAEHVRGSPARAQRLLRPFADAGLRVVVGPLSDERSDLDLLQLSELDAISCELGADMSLPTQLCRSALDYGKIVMVRQADSMAQLSELFNHSVHYVSGEAVSPLLPSPDFDFPQD